jgi:hypothetical protein
VGEAERSAATWRVRESSYLMHGSPFLFSGNFSAPFYAAFTLPDPAWLRLLTLQMFQILCASGFC